MRRALSIPLCVTLFVPDRVYPKLYALVDGTTPNYAGMFLRGRGTQVFNSGGYGNTSYASGNLGVIQGDALRNITGSVSTGGPGRGYVHFNASGIFQTFYNHSDFSNIYSGRANTPYGFNIDFSRQVSTASKNRPVNVAVRYFIRTQ